MKIGLPNIPPVALAVVVVLLGAVLILNSPRACEQTPDLEAAAARSGLVKVHEYGGQVCRGAVYTRGGAPWVYGYQRVTATPGVVVIQWPGPSVSNDPLMTRVGGAEIYGDPTEINRLLSLLPRH